MDNKIEKRGSVLFGTSKGMTGQIASRLIDEGVIEELMPPQKSYREKRRKEIRRMLYNLIRARSLSRAHSREIKVAVPLAMIHDNEKEYHRVSHRGVKSVIEAFSKAEMIEVEQGKPFLQCPADWKKKCVRENNLKGKMTEVWAKGRLKEKIDDYLTETTHVGADVKICVEEKTVMLRDNSENRIQTLSSYDARQMRNTVKKVNEAVPQTGVRLVLPPTTVTPTSSTSSKASEAPSTATPSSSASSNTSEDSSTVTPTSSTTSNASEASSTVTPSSSASSNTSEDSSTIREHTSLQRPSEGISWLSQPPHLLSSTLPSHSQASSAIREHTSSQRRHEVVSSAITNRLQSAHNEVKRRCPQAWNWNHRLSDDGSHIIYDVPNRALSFKRAFVRGSWDCGGRFYAHVQNVPSDWRKHMRIGGEPVVELDYDNLHIAMLYAEEGKRLSGDAYDITSRFDLGEEMDEAIGLNDEEMEFYREKQRTVVKRALNTLLNAENYQSAYKALKHREWTEDIGVGLANEVFKPLVSALRSKHTPISDYLHSDVGIRLQRKDSDLACRVMKETGAIGIHDGFVIEASREEKLREVMKKAFADEYNGYEIGVSREFEPLTESTGDASDTGGDFASDRPALAQNGAERKSEASPTLI